MTVDTLIGNIMAELSQGHDCAKWYCAPGMAVIAVALLEQAEELLGRGVCPLRIAEGYKIAAGIAYDHLHGRFHFNADDIRPIVMTALLPTITNHCKQALADIVAKAMLAVADIERHDVTLDLVRVEEKVGGRLEDTMLVRGIAVFKYLSLAEVPLRIEDAKVAVMGRSYDPQNLLANHSNQQANFDEMLQKCRDVGATLAVCQWGFDQDQSHLMIHTGSPAVVWVNTDDLESIAMATGGHTVLGFQELSPTKLGKAGIVHEKNTRNCEVSFD